MLAAGSCGGPEPSRMMEELEEVVTLTPGGPPLQRGWHVESMQLYAGAGCTGEQVTESARAQSYYSNKQVQESS